MAPSTGWSIAGQATVASSQLLQLVVFARLLEAADFGIGAIYLLLVAVGQLLWDFGTSAAVIQRRDTTLDQLSTLYVFNIGSSMVFGLVLWVCAPLVSGILGTPEAEPMLKWAGIAALLAATAGQYRAMHLKYFRLKVVAQADMLAALAGCAIGISAAYLRMGAYSFVAASIASAAIHAMLLIASGLRFHRPKFKWRPCDVQYYFRFGSFHTGSAFINFAYVNLDILIFGNLLGTDDLGKYALAKQICVRPLEVIYPIFIRSVLPALAKLQGDLYAYRECFLRALRVLNALYLPVFAILIGTADTLVPALFGEKWREVGPVFQLLAAAHAVRFFMVPTNVSLMASGEVSRGFYWDAAASILLFISLIISHGAGVIGMVVSMLATYTLLLYPHWHFVVRPNLQTTFAEWMASAIRPLCLSCVAAATAYVVASAISGSLLSLLSSVSAGFAIYLLLSIWLNKPALRSALGSSPAQP